MGMTRRNIRQALQHAADNPSMDTDELVALPVSELVARTLFEIANEVSPKTKARANNARKLIFDRMVGRRKPGTHPARRNTVSIEFQDLTGEGA